MDARHDRAQAVRRGAEAWQRTDGGKPRCSVSASVDLQMGCSRRRACDPPVPVLRDVPDLLHVRCHPGEHHDAAYYIGFIALGVTFVIITGGIDLSMGTMMMCAAMPAARRSNWASRARPRSCWASRWGSLRRVQRPDDRRLKMPPFIVTLGTHDDGHGRWLDRLQRASATPHSQTARRLVQKHLPLPGSQRGRPFPPAASAGDRAVSAT